MTSENDSKKQILKSSSIVGGASLLTILIGLIKVKVLALLLGPSGIGFMGMLTTIMTAGATLFGMGLSISGVRELALNRKDEDKLSDLREALFSANFLLGLIAIIFVYFFSEPLSNFFFKSREHSFSIFIIGFGVFFSLMLGSQNAVFQGLRKITELAKVKVIGALLSAIIGSILVWNYGERGVPLFVISLPIISFLIAFFYICKLPRLNSFKIDFSRLKLNWVSLFTLGFAFMLTALMSIGCQLAVRYIVNLKLGIEAVGYFQAAWAISMTYITFVLGAMAADYYPRLAENIKEQSKSNKLVNEQTEFALLFSAPILILMLSFSPMVIGILYSNSFHASSNILKWQVLGDVFKVASWPLGFILLAKGYRKTFFLSELLWNSLYTALVYFYLDFFGVQVTGYAFAVSYFIYFFVLYFICNKVNCFQWERGNVVLFLSLSISSILIVVISSVSNTLSIILGVITASVFLFFIYKNITNLGINNKLVRKLQTIFSAISKLIKV